jgi:predicted amidohydrolase
MSRARSIAVAQTTPFRGDVEANIEQHVRLACFAAEEHAQVLVFPELSLTGYELDLASALAFEHGDARLAPLVDVASSCSMTVIVGAPIRIASRLYIGAFILSPSRTVSLYTKQHLGAFSTSVSCDGVVPPAEATVFHPGTRNPLVRFGGHTAAVAVCADTGQPSHPRHAADCGAKTYLASMFTVPSEFDRESASLRAYAVEHSMTVALANYGGPSGGLASAGRSTIWSETGELLVQLEPTGTGVAIAIESPRAGWRARAIMAGDL